MAKLSLKSIRRENARLALEAIARKKHITKLEIAEETGLSLMTAGKLVSILGAGGIITKSMSTSQKVGRRAEVFRIRHDWLIPVFEISSPIFKFLVTDLEGNILDKIEYHCSDDPQYVANEFIRFLHRTLELLRSRYKRKKALGIGVAVAGVYDEKNDRIVSTMLPELSSIKLMANISKIFKTKNVVIGNANRLAASGLIESTENYRDMTISCITINDSIECTTWDRGKYICGKNNLAGRIGDIPFAQSRTYANFMRIAQNVDDIFSPVLFLMKAISVMYDPDKIYLCSDKFVFYPAIRDRLRYALKNEMMWPGGSCPEVAAITATTIECVGAIISRVIENWLDSLIEKEINQESEEEE